MFRALPAGIRASPRCQMAVWWRDEAQDWGDQEQCRPAAACRAATAAAAAPRHSSPSPTGSLARGSGPASSGRAKEEAGAKQGVKASPRAGGSPQSVALALRYERLMQRSRSRSRSRPQALPPGPTKPPGPWPGPGQGVEFFWTGEPRRPPRPAFHPGQRVEFFWAPWFKSAEEMPEQLGKSSEKRAEWCAQLSLCGGKTLPLNM